MRKRIQRIYNRCLRSNLDRYKCIKYRVEKIKHSLKKPGFWSRVLKKLKPKSKKSACIPQDEGAAHPRRNTVRISVDPGHKLLGRSQIVHDYGSCSSHEALTASSAFHVPVQSCMRRPPQQWLPEIRIEPVDLGIDWERWEHSREHNLPSQPGPPPQKPLPPLPYKHRPLKPHRSLRRVPGRNLRTAFEGKARLSESRVSGERVLERSGPRADGGLDQIITLPSLTPGSPSRGKLLVTWIKPIDKDIAPTMFPSMFPSTLSGPSPPVTRPREASDSVASRISPLTHHENSTSLHRAERVGAKHQTAWSGSGERGAISPLLGERIDEMLRIWDAACSKPMEEKI